MVVVEKLGVPLIAIGGPALCGSPAYPCIQTNLNCRLVEGCVIRNSKSGLRAFKCSSWLIRVSGADMTQSHYERKAVWAALAEENKKSETVSTPSILLLLCPLELPYIGSFGGAILVSAAAWANPQKGLRFGNCQGLLSRILSSPTGDRFGSWREPWIHNNCIVDSIQLSGVQNPWYPWRDSFVRFRLWCPSLLAQLKSMQGNPCLFSLPHGVKTRRFGGCNWSLLPLLNSFCFLKPSFCGI